MATEAKRYRIASNDTGSHYHMSGLPTTIARSFDSGQWFVCELTPDGILYRPVDTGNTFPNASMKLSEDDVDAIREAHYHGESQASIARRYQVSRTTISKIVNWTRRK